MAGTVQNPTFNGNLDTGDGNGYLVSWTLTTANTDGTAIEMLQYTDLCVQATATWGGATLTMQGSCDGTNWFAVRDPSHTAWTLTADGGKQILERPRYIRPSLTVAGAGATVVITMTARRNPPANH